MRHLQSEDLNVRAVECGTFGTCVVPMTDRACLIVRPENLSLADHQAVLIELAGRLAGVAWGLELEADDGLRMALGIGDLGRSTGTLTVTPGPDPERHIVVAPFHSLLAALPKADRRAPGDNLRKIALTVHGAKDRKLHIRNISLLRDDDRPRGKGFILGGRAATNSDVKQVHLQQGEAKHVTPILDGGYYMFLNKIPSNAVVQVSGNCGDGSVVFPTCGRHVEVNRDLFDVDFRI